MRRGLRWFGNVCIAVSLLGMAGVALLAFGPEAPPPWVQTVPTQLAPRVVGPAPSTAAAQPAAGSAVTLAQPAEGFKPITHLNVERIGLDAEVVPAHLVDRNGAATWEV